MPRKSRELKFKVTGNGCHEITSHVKHPSGYVQLNRKVDGIVGIYAHRYVYELKHGKIPKGKIILHSCDNRACINIFHLRAGTHKDNSNDCITRGRIANGEKIGTNKLSSSDVMRIRSLHGKISQRGIARMFNMSHTQIGSIS